MSTPPPGEPSGPPATFLASRLALEANVPVPSVADLGLEDAREAAFAWQEQRSAAFWNELAALLANPASDWVRPIHGIIGAIGEEVLVAIEAEVEKEIANAQLSSLQADEYVKRAVYSRSLRFFAEGQGNALVVAAHGLTNMTIRTFALDPQFQVSSLSGHPFKVKVGDFTPQSEAKSAWLSFNMSTVTGLKAIAAGLDTTMGVLAAELDTMANEPSLAALIELRNGHYHRWRGESPGVTGINLKGDSLREKLAQGESVGLSTQMLPDYVEGEQALQDLLTATRAALDGFVAHMPAFLQAWYTAFHAVTSPTSTT